MASQERFGYEWQKYSGLRKEYESQLRNWISPIVEQDINGKSVLDAGCGMGRNSYYLLKWGARSLIAIDYDTRTIESAKLTLRTFREAKVEFMSIYDLKYADKFDIVICVGVLHHLEDVPKALSNLYGAVVPGGKLIMWIYGREGNELLLAFLDPIRKYITSRLPLPIVHFLSFFASIPLYLYLKVFQPKKPAYFAELKNFAFSNVHSIIFDQLIPRIAHYWTREEVINLCTPLGARTLDVHAPPNKNGWTVIVGK